MALIGLEKLYYALVTKDDDIDLTFGTPVYLPGIKEIGVAPTKSTNKLFAENVLWEQVTSLEDVAVTINLADLSNKDSAILLGQSVATEGGVFAKEQDEPPYVALLYKANKSNGESRFQVLYKGKFTLPNDDAKTKEGQVDYKTPNIAATFQPTKNNGMWKYQVDTDDADAPIDLDTSFFTSVIVPTKKAMG